MKRYEIQVTMPSGEKLRPIYVDPDAFMFAPAYEVGAAIGKEIGDLVKRRLKA